MDEGEKSSMANAVAEAIPLRVVLMPLTLPSLVGGEEEEAMVHEDDCYEFIEFLTCHSLPPTLMLGIMFLADVSIGRQCP